MFDTQLVPRLFEVLSTIRGRRGRRKFSRLKKSDFKSEEDYGIGSRRRAKKVDRQEVDLTTGKSDRCYRLPSLVWELVSHLPSPSESIASQHWRSSPLVIFVTGLSAFSTPISIAINLASFGLSIANDLSALRDETQKSAMGLSDMRNSNIQYKINNVISVFPSNIEYHSL